MHSVCIKFVFVLERWRYCIVHNIVLQPLWVPRRACDDARQVRISLERRELYPAYLSSNWNLCCMRWWQVGEVTYSCSASIGCIVVHTNWLSGSYFLDRTTLHTPMKWRKFLAIRIVVSYLLGEGCKSRLCPARTGYTMGQA